jgi:GAF domain-containing protein
MAEPTKFRNAIKDIRRRWIAFGIAYAYLTYWDEKTKYRERLHEGALAVFGTSGVVTLFELVENLVGADRLHQVIKFVAGEYPAIRVTLELVFLAAVVVALWLHYTESKKPVYQYAFVSCVAELLERRGKATIPEMLELFHFVFRRTGVAHVCMAHPCDDGLVIDRGHVYPAEQSESFFKPIPPEGVAGRVFNDGRVRYVPRLFFPFNRRSWPLPFTKYRVWLPTMKFPHSVSYAHEEDATTGKPKLAAQKPDLDSVFGEDFQFQSFLSLPLMLLDGTRCVGILNFDFHRTDPIWKPEIEMALVLASLFAAQPVVQKELTSHSLAQR